MGLRQLVDDVLSAGGRLVREVSADSPSYSHLVGIVNGRGLLPDDDRLLLSERGNRVEIRLASVSDWVTQTPREIADPTRSRRSHPAVAELRAAKELSGITPADVRARGFRLLNALALEAKARGIEVTAVEINRQGYRQAFDGYHGHLMFRFEQVRCVVSVSQNTDRVPHVPTRAEEERQRRGYDYVRSHDYVKSEHLTIHASDDGKYSGREKWSDTKSLALEYRLHDVLASLIARDEREKSRIERERLEAIERRKREEIATARARSIAEKSRHAIVLAKQSLNGCEDLDIRRGYELEQSFTVRLSEHPDSKTAVEAQVADLARK